MRLFGILLFSFLTSCGNNSVADRSQNKAEWRQNKKDSGDRVVEISSNDTKMNEAIQEAQGTYPDFLEMLKSGCIECDRFNVKIRFEKEETVEHIWLDNLHYKENSLFGVIANEPENFNNIQIGDTIEVKKESVSDWFYVQKGNLIGGYTIKVIYDKMNNSEKEILENEFGAKIK